MYRLGKHPAVLQETVRPLVTPPLRYISMVQPKRRPFMIPRSIAAGLAAVTLSAAIAGTAAAHHGWAWAEGEQTTLEGTIESISFAPPHPSLTVESEGTVWQIDLGNPRQTERSGFAEGSAKVGDAITVLGNKSQDENERLMKAVRITVGDKNFDMYPERIQTN
jgi:hypothetical protein